MYTTANDRGGNARRQVAIGDQANTGAGRADVFDELDVAGPVEDDYDQVGDVTQRAIARRFSATVASRLTACFALGPTTSFSI